MKQLFFALLLAFFCQNIDAQTFISTNAVWKYLDDGSNQGTAWTANGFNDASWASGAAQLGYGDGDENTVVGYGPNSSDKYPTTYFRRSFNVTNPANVASLDVDIQVDDGAVVYLNGVELFRQGMPSGTISYNDYANVTIGGTDENIFTSYNGLSSAALVAGTNVLAVEVHQTGGTSSDISFNLQLEAGAIPGQPVVTRGPYLQMANSTSILVKWRTDISSDAEVRYGTSPGNLNQSVAVGSAASEHAITISGLTPNSTYYYALANGAGIYEGGTSDYTFRTAPTTGAVHPTRAWILGDAGTANQDQRDVRDAYKNFVNANSLHTDMILMLGDNAYNSGTDVEYQNAFFDIYPEMLRKTAVWSTRGNHDSYGGNNYYDIFNMPTNGEAGGIPSSTESYYSFDYGNIHFICLNSESESRSVGSTMYNWCENDLMNTNSDWIVVFFHHPPYTKGSHDSDSEGQLIEMRQNFLPLLEAHGVDLVLSGHSHSYERTYLLKGHYGNSGSLNGSMILDNGSGNPLIDNAYAKSLTGPNAGDGAVYITAGSSGKVTGTLTQHPAMYSFLYQMGSVIMEVENTEMRVRFLNNNGSFTDEFIIEKNDLSNQAPAAVNDNANTFQAQAVTVDVLANDSDPNGSLDPSTVTIVANPSKGTITNINASTGEITYLPNVGESGSDVFTYTVCDDGVPSPVLCDNATVTINILINSAPVAIDDAANTNENVNVAVNVVANDTDAESNIDISSVTITQSPANGSITNISPTGVVTFDPNNGFTGSDVFKYTVNDQLGLTSNEATATINVLANVAPTAANDNDNTVENTTVLVDVLANDIDLNGDLDPNSLSTIGLLQAAHGSTNVIAGVGIEYTPANGYSGYDQFEYRVCDQSQPSALCDVALVTVLVSCDGNSGITADVISGTVFEDNDNNGANINEPGLSNVTIDLYLDANNNGLIDGGDTYQSSTVTAGDGTYSFAVSPVYTTPGPTLTLNIDIATDDAWEKNSGSMENDKSEHEFGKIDTWNGMRFQNAGLPYGATITSAYIEYISDRSETNTPAIVNYYGEKTLNASTFNEVNYGISSRTRTSNSVNWDLPSWNQNDTYTSPDLSTIIQELVDQPGWNANSDISILVEGIGSQRRKWKSWEDQDSPVNAPHLVIDYEIQGGSEFNYVLQVNSGTLPQGASYTTDNVETATFTGTGQEDCNNNFGILACVEGTSCDDGNACTINDVYDANCGCAGTFQDSDNDGVCDADDQCPGNDDALIGTACDDGNACTINDVYDANCGCAGTFQDSDNDGVCDADDQCPGNDDALIGTACNDGNACTINDVYDANCGCAGTFQDSDNDGVCDADDQCPGNDDALIGTSCDDGNACTINDVYDANCGCAGTFQDSDNDGVCDADDQCPGNDDALIGTACDDGDACTVGEIYDGNCNCSGGVVQDSDNDGVCDANDQCPGTDDAIIGTVCDDGSACTINDVYDSNCGCSGTPVADSDNDGVCDSEDQCPGTDDALIGTACDDGDACTVGEIYDGSCNCSGGVVQDSDNDGICDAYDQCPGNDDALIGTACNDGNACTVNDVYDSNCGCAGTFQDSDNDGVCDAEDQCPGNDDALIGTACDDGDACTVGETYDGSCNCSGGIFQDTDSDGVCDANDQCPGNDDALIGTACNDDNACTINDVYDANCGCAGTFQDSDNDGVCDADDQCPGNDDALIGTACDDGNPATNNDIYDGNCSCSGTQCPSAGTPCNDGNPQTINDVEDGFCNCAGTPGAPSTVCLTISSSDDDVEENQNTGEIYSTSSDIELVYDSYLSAENQTVGLRFNNVSIPQGANITNAYIQFTVDEVSSEVTNLIIAAEATDNADPFTAANYSISSRARTTATANWSPPAWNNIGDAGADQRTVDISAVIQEVVNRPGYAENNSIAIIIQGTGSRTADSYDGSPADAAMLCIDYFAECSDADDDGVCDVDDQCPGLDDALIGTPCDDGSACTSNDVYDANCGCSGTPNNDSDNDGVCDLEDQCPGFDDALIGTACDDGDACTTGETYDNDCGCTGGIFQDDDNDGVCDAEDQCPGFDDYLDANMNNIPDACEVADTTTEIFQITASDNDAQENNKDQVRVNENELKLGKDRTVGLRFTGVDIPSNATITSAYIEFTSSHDKTSDPSSVTIYGELASNAAVFVENNFNITNRPSSTSSVDWSNIEGWNQNVIYNSPDISAIVQELIDQPGWTNGNSLAFIFEPNGNQERKFKAYDNNPAEAPRLIINYIGGTFTRVIKNEQDKSLVASNELVLFPNPVSDVLNMNYTSASKGAIDIQLVNIIGQVKYEAKEVVAEGKNFFLLDISHLPAGNYVIKVSQGTDVKTMQIMVN